MTGRQIAAFSSRYESPTFAGDASLVGDNFLIAAVHIHVFQLCDRFLAVHSGWQYLMAAGFHILGVLRVHIRLKMQYLQAELSSLVINQLNHLG